MINELFSFDNAVILCTSYQTTWRHIPEDHYVVIMFFRGHVVGLFILKRAYYCKERTKAYNCTFFVISKLTFIRAMKNSI